MKLFIITMEDPVYTLPFLKEVIRERANDVVGVAVAKGGRLRIGKKRSRLVYLLSLMLIMGIPHFVKYAWITIAYRVRKAVSSSTPLPSPSILSFAGKYGIPGFEVQSPNDKEFLAHLASLGPDIIINQSQSILKKELLAIPSIGVLNRHNALLPRNRGRLTPFWVLFKGETETGVSIHYVEEGIDAGDIVVQERFEVTPSDNFNSIVKRNYQIAPKAMLKAIDKLERGETDVIRNCDSLSTYNTVPSLQDAIRFRLGRLGVTRC